MSAMSVSVRPVTVRTVTVRTVTVCTDCACYRARLLEPPRAGERQHQLREVGGSHRVSGALSARLRLRRAAGRQLHVFL